MKTMQSLLGGAVFIVLGFAFAVVCKAQYPPPPPAAPTPNVTASPFVEPKAVPSKECDLDGKVVCVIPKNFIGLMHKIENPKCRTMGGRTFLVGKAVPLEAKAKKPERSALAGSVVWVAVDDIGSIHVFQNVEQLRKELPLLFDKWGEIAPAPAPPPAPGVNESEAPELPPQDSPWGYREKGVVPPGPKVKAEPAPREIQRIPPPSEIIPR